MSRNEQSCCSGFEHIRPHFARSQRGLAGHASTGCPLGDKTTSGSLFDRTLEAIPPAPDATMQGRNPVSQQTPGNHAEGNEYEDSIRRGKITTKTVLQGSGRERSDLGRFFEARNLMSARKVRFLATNAGTPIPARNGRGVGTARSSSQSTL